MAGFETPKYEPPKPLKPIQLGSMENIDDQTDRFDKRWLENERKIRGHIKGPWKLTPAEENEQVLGNDLWNLIQPRNKLRFPLIGPPADHPIKEMQLQPLHNLIPGRPAYVPLQDRKERLEW